MKKLLKNLDSFGTWLEDALDVFSKRLKISALMTGGKIDPTSLDLDYSANFCRQLGYDLPEFDELTRLYLVIHADHESGNVLPIL
eukprot:gene9251-19202_t